MYTQYQRGLSVVLLISLFLQSCGNLALDGHHQMKGDTQEAVSHTSSKRQPLVAAEAPPAAPEPRQKEEIKPRERVVHTRGAISPPGGSTVTSTSPAQRKRPSVTPRQAPRMASPVRPEVRAQEGNGTNLGDWHAQVREKIEALGKAKPGEASRLSQAMLGGYQGTPAQQEALKTLDMAPPDSSLRPGLRGGMMRGDDPRAGGDVPAPPQAEPTAVAVAEAELAETRQNGRPPAIQVPPRPIFDPTVRPEVACPLIARKLNSPEQELDPDESIELLTTCVAYGTERAKKMEGKQGIMVLGNTGAGKSTFINFLAGCTMELTSPRALGMRGSGRVAVVRAPDQGGARSEMTPIGHSRQSQTFMPEIAPAPDSDFVYCDCPGFLDNRGAEINIANAINVKNTLAAARDVRVVLLLNYHALHADKARGLDEMLNICTHLFGSVENLERCAPSILLGITQVPRDTELEELKEDVVDERHPVTRVLAERVFTFDVAGGDNTPSEGWWNRNECLARLAALPPLEAPSTIFRTVLTDSDEKRLGVISQGIGERVKAALDENDFPRAAEHLDHLDSLGIIEHNEMGPITERATRDLREHFQGKIYAFKGYCLRERFPAAEGLLREFRRGCATLGNRLVDIVDLSQLEHDFQDSKERAEREEETKRTIQVLQEKERERGKQLREQQAKLDAMHKTTAQLDTSNKQLQAQHKIDLEAQQGIVRQLQQAQSQAAAEQKRLRDQMQRENQRNRELLEAEQERLRDINDSEVRRLDAEAQGHFEAASKAHQEDPDIVSDMEFQCRVIDRYDMAIDIWRNLPRNENRSRRIEIAQARRAQVLYWNRQQAEMERGRR
ncbi:MAG: GTPase [Roseivirga sp.]